MSFHIKYGWPTQCVNDSNFFVIKKCNFKEEEEKITIILKLYLSYFVFDCSFYFAITLDQKHWSQALQGYMCAFKNNTDHTYN